METDISHITSLIGDPIRTHILWSLLDGRAYTATELAIGAGTSPQNISMHLSKLVHADLLMVETQGRHKYYKLSKPEVAYAIEALGSLIPAERHKNIVSNSDNSAIRFCRTCYDHLAGKIGVLLTEAMIKQGIIALSGRDYIVTGKGAKFFAGFQIDIEELKEQRRVFARPCLDWSERKHHLAGGLGAALLDRLLSLGYLRRSKSSRAVTVTAKGQLQLYHKFKVMI